jgi:hypothetical protein
MSPLDRRTKRRIDEREVRSSDRIHLDLQFAVGVEGFDPPTSAL